MSKEVEVLDDESNELDVLPADLQPDLADHEDYIFPDNDRRKVPGYLYLAISTVVLVSSIIWSDSPFISTGLILGAFALGLFGGYSVFAGKKLLVDERSALTAATEACGFPVGHASAQMTWYGAGSKPMWRILLYSADEPPTQRGFVLIDGVNRSVIDSISEKNPETWQ